MKTWRTWTKADDELLAKLWKKYSVRRVAKKIGRSENAVRIRARNNNLGPCKSQKRTWTEEEEAKLEHMWEKKESIEVIARKLKRTTCSVRVRISQKKLGSKLLFVDGVVITTFLATLLNLKRHPNSIEIKRYINSGAPWFYCYMEKVKYRVVNLDKFWKWAEQHQTVYDLSKIEFLSLGKEPKWMYEYRRKKSLEKSAKRWGEYT